MQSRRGFFRKRAKDSSIVNRLTGFVLAIIIIQTVVFVIMLVGGGVTKQARLNAYQQFHDKVKGRQEYLQHEMNTKWTNFDHYLLEIKKLLEEGKGLHTEVSGKLVDMIRDTGATGAFVILLPDGKITDQLPAVYLRDYDPNTDSYTDDDIYMIVGPPELERSTDIPLDRIWRTSLLIEEGNRDFIEKPLENALISGKAEPAGYWSRPFRLNSEDVEIITYTVPFLNSDGRVAGIFGIDITLNYLVEYLSVGELQPLESLEYLISFRSGDEGMYPIVMNGALQRRMISSDKALPLEPADEGTNLYRLMNQQGDQVFYALAEELKLNRDNTPFENEDWFLVGIMGEDYLFSYSNTVTRIIWISMITALLLGALGGFLTSFQVTRPIVNLAKQVGEMEHDKKLTFEKTGYYELDQLSSAIEKANQLMIESASRLSKIVTMFDVPIAAYEINKKNRTYFITDNFWKILGFSENPDYSYQEFTEQFRKIFSQPEDKALNSFRVNGVNEKWIKLSRSESDDTLIGAVVDITREVSEKRQIQYERDHDPLTSIFNRKGFRWEFERWYAETDKGVAALVTFDMDNLKGINDRYGHKWGDHYIITFVQYLKDLADEEHCIPGRRSGDEFVCLLHGFDTKDDLRRVMDDFYESLENSCMKLPDNESHRVSASGGLLWIEDKTLSYDELLHYSDEILYQAKKSGKSIYLEKFDKAWSIKNGQGS